MANNRIFFSTALLVAAIGLGGCAGTQNKTQPLYSWGSFPSSQYAALQQDNPEKTIPEMEKQVELAKSENTALPPGFRAHLGMLYGMQGQTTKTVELLRAEKAAFPEATTYIDFLLAKFKKP